MVDMGDNSDVTDVLVHGADAFVTSEKEKRADRHRGMQGRRR